MTHFKIEIKWILTAANCISPKFPTEFEYMWMDIEDDEEFE